MQSTSKINTLFLILSLCAFPIATTQAQTPAPALQVQFALPLADKTTAVAILLPAPAQAAWMAYATKEGKIGSYLLTSTLPTPQPEPPPVPPPPVPPQPVPPPPTPPNVLPPIPDWIIPGNARQDRTCKGRCKWK